MGRKKKFIDKKNAHHFFLLHRSQQDPEYHKDGGSKLILHPADDKTAVALDSMGVESGHGLGTSYVDREDLPSVVKQRIRDNEIREVDEMGLPIDGYDYSKHLGEIGGGVFVSASGKVGSGRIVAPSQSLGTVQEHSSRIDLPAEVLASEVEHDRMLSAITVGETYMDDDLKVALEEASVEEEEFDVEDMDDDFMAQLIEAEENNADDEDAFDYEKHVQRLIAEAEAAEDGDDYDDELTDIDEEDLLSPDQLPGASDVHKRRDIDDHFDRVFEQYDDEDIGELEDGDFDETVAGELSVETELVADVLAKHLETMELEAEDGKGILEKGAKLMSEEIKKSKSAGLEVDEVESEEEEEFDGKEFERADRDDEDDAKTMLKMWGTYSEKPKEKWDCETVLSTYSTIDNHPTVISAGRRRKKKSQQQQVVEDDEETTDIDEDETEVEPQNLGKKRSQKETPEEKRLRKQLIKEQRRQRRSEKKNTKMLFKIEEEIVKKSTVQQKGEIKAGVSTFKM